MSELAAGKSPRARIGALKRRVASASVQAMINLNTAMAYSKQMQSDLAEIDRLEVEIEMALGKSK